MTKMIVGLGNPGNKYENTKHNMGFTTLDSLAQELNVTFSMDKTFMAEIGQTFVDGEKVFLVKPQTFMNDSGRSVKPLMSYYNLDIEDILVIVDDMDSPVGRVRLRDKGSSGGQNGIKSIIQHIGSDQFKRVKIGIGRLKGNHSVPNHVLSPFDKVDQEDAEQGVQKAKDAVIYYLESSNFTATQNKFNSK